MSENKYLITGGAGFIGSHLAELLIENGKQVIILDDLSTGKLSNIPTKSEFIQGDAGDLRLLAQIIPQVSGVFHLAAIASVEKSTNEWQASTMVNLINSVSILEAIAKDGRKIPFVFASSAAIYGNNPDCPLSESNAANPIVAYGIDKFASELHTQVATLIHAIPTAALRFFNVYGERQDPKSPYSGVISIFINRAMSGQTLTINGDGGQLRDFIYVKDICKMLEASMEKLHENPAHYRLNACTGKPTSINALAELIIQLTNSGSNIIHADARIGDIYQSFGKPDSMNHLLNIKAQMNLNNGLQRTINWLKQHP